MIIDIPQERGMAYADYRWGDANECRFPLFNGLAPLPVDWMYLVYLVMYLGNDNDLGFLVVRMYQIMFFW